MNNKILAKIDKMGVIDMRSENIELCDVLSEMNKVIISKKMNSSRILGPFRLFVFKDGRVGTWGNYVLKQDKIGVPVKITVVFNKENIRYLTFSPSGINYFEKEIFLSKECLMKTNLKLIKKNEYQDENDYSYIYEFVVENYENTIQYNFFSKFNYNDNGLSFSRIVVNVK